MHEDRHCLEEPHGFLTCEECVVRSDTGQGWRALHGRDLDDPRVYTVVYCPRCAPTEFGAERKPESGRLPDHRRRNLPLEGRLQRRHEEQPVYHRLRRRERERRHHPVAQSGSHARHEHEEAPATEPPRPYALRAIPPFCRGRRLRLEVVNAHCLSGWWCLSIARG
jgi:hypothetical protein